MRIEYYAGGRKRRVALEAGPLAVSGRRSLRDDDPIRMVRAEAGETSVIATGTLSVSDAPAEEIVWLRRRFGMTPVAEGSHGKVLLSAPLDAGDPVRLVARAAVAIFERGTVGSAQPNFLRLMAEPEPEPVEAAESTEGEADGQWALDNLGRPGVIGADVAARAAWTITRGDPDVRVAVLDDGVDTAHPYLKSGVVAERDFRDADDVAAPRGNDAHGTACAGIICSRDDDLRGLAPDVSLVVCRIGGRSPAGWLADDFAVADAVDWCWDTAGSAVLSNSWGGGPPSDLVLLAFDRARTRGRGGLGSVVVAAAGNSQASSVLYPGDAADVLTVGASNQWDERKTRSSRDGETNWGSNSGPGLDLMAPGVRIRTTDVAGPAGSSPGLSTGRFNGTSAATPFVAAAAAMVLSVAPELTEAAVRTTLTGTADSMGPSGWDPAVGFGRLNVFRALRAARRG
ncbi:S8 family serine peptidase [Paractinoplanes toevensis]|uniref:Peptidase S8/S53 domain-containing protein n=1 Tax=Paractinoplanes toevensis TaxID=571911 RepID=A0A919TA28_9ACTN|nr:S8 family serine peptidase [Actinoplanes toevensis]GIM91838.1 hypothetical protein Ato02nite_036310 [Actinoplanes toevensis]